MLYYRRKILLALLEKFGGKMTAIQLQKYLFLFTKKQQMDKAFYFIPFRYGCFSFQANQDMATLKTYGYIDEVAKEYILQKRDESYMVQLNMFDQQALNDVFDEFGQMTQEELITYTYVRYPFFAINSTISHQLLTPEQQQKVDAQKRHIDGCQLFTIGYEGVTLEQYINRLILEDVHVLCDVRKNAFSQKYGFNKSQLEKACEGVGIKYVHVPNLGIESDKRQDLRTQHDYDILFAEYDRTTLQQNADALTEVYDIILSNERVALTCFEKNPQQCHRSRVARALMTMSDGQYSLKHIQF